MDTVNAFIDAILTRAPAPPLWAALPAVLLGIVLVFFSQSWKFTRHIVTLVHEAGHAVIGVLTGRRLDGIRLHTDTSGVTTTAGRERGVARTLTALAGYPAGAAVAGLTWLGVYTDRALLTAGIMIVSLVVLLLFTRNFWGWMVTLSVGAGLGVAFWKGSPLLIQFILLLLAGLLAAGSFRTLWEERTGRKHGQQGSDIWELGMRTGFPATVWWGISLLVSVAWIAVPVYVYLVR